MGLPKRPKRSLSPTFLPGGRVRRASFVSIFHSLRNPFCCWRPPAPQRCGSARASAGLADAAGSGRSHVERSFHVERALREDWVVGVAAAVAEAVSVPGGASAGKAGRATRGPASSSEVLLCSRARLWARALVGGDGGFSEIHAPLA